MNVRIPIPEGIEHPKLLVKKANGKYEEVTTKIENGYLVYETEELGMVSIIGDKKAVTVPKDDPSMDHAMPPVQGNHTNQTQGVGGAATGDTTQCILYGTLFISSMTVLIYTKRKAKYTQKR